MVDPIADYLTAYPWRNPTVDWRGGPFTVPEHLHTGLVDYIEGHHSVGGFLTAVLENDLTNAVAHADATSLPALPYLVGWLLTVAPATCWGSPTKVREWLLQREKTSAVQPLAPQREIPLFTTHSAFKKAVMAGGLVEILAHPNPAMVGEIRRPIGHTKLGYRYSRTGGDAAEGFSPWLTAAEMTHLGDGVLLFQPNGDASRAWKVRIVSGGA